MFKIEYKHILLSKISEKFAECGKGRQSDIWITIWYLTYTFLVNTPNEKANDESSANQLRKMNGLFSGNRMKTAKNSKDHSFVVANRLISFKLRS